MDKVNMIMERFDFAKVIAYMTLVNWVQADGQVIPIGELQNIARDLMLRVLHIDYGDGLPAVPRWDEDTGLVAWVNENNQIVLHFYIESKTSYDL